MRKTLTFLLALIMLLQTAACAGTPPEADADEKDTAIAETNDNPADETAEETESISKIPEEIDYVKLPDDLDLQGQTVRLLHDEQEHNIGIDYEEMTGDLLKDTIFETNTRVMEDLNFLFSFIPLPAATVDLVQKANRAGDDCYEIVLAKQNKLPSLMMRNMFANIDDSSEAYINYNAPWWYENFIDEIRVHKSQTFFLAGDASMGVMNRASFMVVNTDLMDRLGKDMNTLYETVLDGKWTLDAYKQLITDVYIDANGNNVKDEGDTYGFSAFSRSFIPHFLYNSGVPITGRNEEGFPTLLINNEKTIKVTEYLYDLFVASPYTYYAEGVNIPEKLASNTVLTFCYQFCLLPQLRDIETNYAIVPEPKYDETISAYAAINHNDSSIYCIPILSEQVENSTAVLEALSMAYYEDVMPVYYEKIIKSKYRRDSSDYAAQMLDIIHDGLTTDFSYIYDSALGQLIVKCCQDLIGVEQSADFASAYKAAEKLWLKNLEKIIDKVRSNMAE